MTRPVASRGEWCGRPGLNPVVVPSVHRLVSWTRRGLLAVLLIASGLVWLRINKRVEGSVLLDLTSGHGVTLADLLSLAAFAAAVVLVWPDR